MISTPWSRSGELLTDREQPIRVVRRHAQLQHRHVRVRVHHLQRHPGSVVESAAGVLVHRLPVGQQRGDLAGQRGRVRGGVAHLEVAASEPAEVVDQRRSGFRRRDHQRRSLPVRADDQDRGRLGQRQRPGEQLVHPVRVVEDRRRAVAQIQRGHRAVLGRPALMVAAPRCGGRHEGVESGALDGRMQNAGHGDRPLTSPIDISTYHLRATTGRGCWPAGDGRRGRFTAVRNSSGSAGSSPAAAFDRAWSTERAPGITVVTPGCWTTQASAAWAGVTAGPR